MSHRIRLLFAACIGILAWIASPLAEAQDAAPPSTNADMLSSELAEKKPMLLLDVRQPEEYAAGHIDDAVLIPLGELEKRYTELPKDKKIVVYCRSGRRSASAIEILRGKGFKNLVNLEGGFTAWGAAQPKKK